MNAVDRLKMKVKLGKTSYGTYGALREEQTVTALCQFQFGVVGGMCTAVLSAVALSP